MADMLAGTAKAPRRVRSGAVADTRKRADMPDRTCSIEGCDEKHEARGWCEKHYFRWYRHGDPLEVKSKGDPNRPDVCVIDGCEGEHHARGWCKKHYNRWRRHGDPLWEREIGYRAAHLRVERERGTPSRCEHCETTDPDKRYAWALRWWDESASVQTDKHTKLAGLRFSLNPDDYMRLCTRCHLGEDLRVVTPETVEQIDRLVEEGLTYAAIADVVGLDKSTVSLIARGVYDSLPTHPPIRER